MTETETTLFAANNQNSDPLSELVGEGKKFKTTSDLAKGKLEADTFINQLKDDNKQLRDELAARARMEELLDRIESTANQRSDPNPNDDRRQEIQTTDLDKLLEQKLSEHEDRKRKTDNIRQVKAKLEELLGTDNFDTKLKARITELQLDEATVNSLASASPNAALRLLGGNNQALPTHYTPPSSSVSITTGSLKEGGQRTMSFYDDLKKKDEKLYWSTKTQLQMHEDAQRLGEQFFNVNK